MFLLGGLVVLMALGDHSFLLLHRRDVTLDYGVQLLAHIVLDIHLIIHYFAGYCLLEFRCFLCMRIFVEFFPCDGDDDYAFPREFRNEMGKEKE